MKYPIGEQSFVRLRKEGFLYVDKTVFIKKIVEGSKYYFLGRPRRFGKSL
ncbi:MAG: AAA family ATPase, partial [Bacteroides sp.]|nr:AAA family ATPase [Bacteroides sp.]